MPNLQLHQLRVAAVGKIICDSINIPVNERDVILACLFHDMGNIIKSDLTYFPDFIATEGIHYWEGVKADFVTRYGTDSHAANVLIMKEIGLSEKKVALLDASGFSRLSEICANDSWELKTLQYADMRVGPRGVLTLDERLSDGRIRYAAHKKAYYDTDEGFKKLSSLAHELERQIFAETAIRPEDITDASVAPIIAQLWEYPVS